MLQVFWDASALSKRYAAEAGSESTDAVWASVSASQMTATFLGYAEAYSILLRKRNRNDLSDAAFAAATSLLRDEIVSSAEFTLLDVDTRDIFAGIALMERHNINSADAVILAAFLRYALALGEVCVLVASDQRLLRAASAEGLRTLNPEQAAASDMPAFLAAL